MDGEVKWRDGQSGGIGIAHAQMNACRQLWRTASAAVGSRASARVNNNKKKHF